MLKRNHIKLSLVLAGLVLLSSSGCRFGNYSSPTPTIASKYQSIEAFHAQATAFTTYAFLPGADAAHPVKNEKDNVPVVNIPTDTLNTFTDPVFVVTETDPTVGSYFFGTDSSHTLKTVFDNTGTISTTLGSDPVPFMGSSTCQTQLQVDESGLLDRSNPDSMSESNGTMISIAGHVKMDLTYYQVFSGDCTSALQRASDCYQDTTGTLCSHDEISTAKETLDLYVRQSGVLAVSDIIHVIGLVYSIHFE